MGHVSQKMDDLVSAESTIGYAGDSCRHSYKL